MPYTTQIDTTALFSTSQLLTELTSEPVQANKAIVGRNAFAHEAGIHQDGVIKDRRTYEIMRPADVGVAQSTLVLGKHSGRHALRHRCEQLGVELSDDRCIVVDTKQRSSVAGVYAAGDIVMSLDQISVAMGHAAIAATALHNDLRNRDGEGTAS